ncbi:MAG: hypothetical protein ACK5RG_05725 [Cyclobacteriaceae bacterium]|jgi:hypothetical protein|nr:hypothetical protein [Flammeovirgaceae bacterium]
MSSTRFLVGLIGMALIVMAVTLFLIKAGVIASPSFLAVTLLVMMVSTALIFLFLERTHPRQPLDFVRNFMLTVVLKIVLSGFYVFVFLRLDPAAANANVSFFIVNYFLFTAYEVTWFAIKKNAE